jgi:hypothetical protein
MKTFKHFKCDDYSISLRDKVYDANNVEVKDRKKIQKILMDCIVKSWSITNGDKSNKIVLMSNGKLYNNSRSDKMIVPNNLEMTVGYMEALRNMLNIPIVAVGLINKNKIIGVSSTEKKLFLLENEKKTWRKIDPPSNVKHWYDKVRSVYAEIKKLKDPIYGVNEGGQVQVVDRKNPQVGILKAWHSKSGPNTTGVPVKYAKNKNGQVVGYSEDNFTYMFDKEKGFHLKNGDVHTNSKRILNFKDELQEKNKIQEVHEKIKESQQKITPEQIKKKEEDKKIKKEQEDKKNKKEQEDKKNKKEQEDKKNKKEQEDKKNKKEQQDKKNKKEQQEVKEEQKEIKQQEIKKQENKLKEQEKKVKKTKKENSVVDETSIITKENLTYALGKLNNEIYIKLEDAWVKKTALTPSSIEHVLMINRFSKNPVPMCIFQDFKVDGGEYSIGVSGHKVHQKCVVYRKWSTDAYQKLTTEEVNKNGKLQAQVSECLNKKYRVTCPKFSTNAWFLTDNKNKHYLVFKRNVNKIWKLNGYEAINQSQLPEELLIETKLREYGKKEAIVVEEEEGEEIEDSEKDEEEEDIATNEEDKNLLDLSKQLSDIKGKLKVEGNPAKQMQEIKKLYEKKWNNGEMKRIFVYHPEEIDIMTNNNNDEKNYVFEKLLGFFNELIDQLKYIHKMHVDDKWLTDFVKRLYSLGEINKFFQATINDVNKVIFKILKIVYSKHSSAIKDQNINRIFQQEYLLEHPSKTSDNLIYVTVDTPDIQDFKVRNAVITKQWLSLLYKNVTDMQENDKKLISFQESLDFAKIPNHLELYYKVNELEEIISDLVLVLKDHQSRHPTKWDTLNISNSAVFESDQFEDEMENIHEQLKDLLSTDAVPSYETVLEYFEIKPTEATSSNEVLSSSSSSSSSSNQVNPTTFKSSNNAMSSNNPQKPVVNPFGSSNHEKPVLVSSNVFGTCVAEGKDSLMNVLVAKKKVKDNV